MISKIFTERERFKPFEYPDLAAFKDAIRQSYWVHTEWNFTGDVHDFHITLSDAERNAVRNALLAISQIEVSVKRFWVNLGSRFPKPEIEQVGVTFGESEVRHADAYSHLLEKLGMNEAFETLTSVPAIQKRVAYLKKSLRGATNAQDRDFALTLALFSLFVENVSLFSQFLIIKSFNQFKTLLKDVDNVVQATQKEETIHALFGTRLVQIIQQENPDWFADGTFTAHLHEMAQEAFDAESEVLDWIFEAGELPFLPKSTVREFIKNRFNSSLEGLGVAPLFPVDTDALATTAWFDRELLAEINTDFFHKKPTTYTKFVHAFTAENIF